MRALSNKCRGRRGNIQEQCAAHQLMLKILAPGLDPGPRPRGPYSARACPRSPREGGNSARV
eukprot:13983884-Alexandrium_andersonii.AAC.1